MRLCQKNIPLNSRPRLSSDTKRENPFNRSVRNCISRKAHSTTGEENTVPSKQQIVPTRQKSLTPFQGGWKSWSMNWRSFGSLGTYQMCPCRKSWSSWKASTKSQTTRIVSTSSVKRWMLPAEPSTTTSSAEPTAASAIKSRRGLCGWYSRFLMTVPSDSVPKKFASL